MVRPVSTELGDPGTSTTAAAPEFHAEIVPVNDTKNEMGKGTTRSHEKISSAAVEYHTGRTTIGNSNL